MPKAEKKIRPVAWLAACLVLTATACSSESPLEAVVPEREGAGVVCTPLDENGVASFATEVVTNRSDDDLSVAALELADVRAEGGGEAGRLVVDEWFLTPLDWEGGRVGPGPLARPGKAALGSVVAPGQKVMLGIAVRGDAVAVPHTMRPRVVHVQDGERGETTLSRDVTVVPAGTTCR